MSKIEKVVLSEFLQIGDLVEVQCDGDSRGYGVCKNIPNGLIGKVVGFYQAEQHVGYVQGFGRKAGVYHSNGAPRVKFPDGSGEYMSPHNLVFVDEALKETRYAAYHAMNDEDKKGEVRISDLPEHKFWEWDEVKYIGDCNWLLEAELSIHSIDFRDKDVWYTVKIKDSGTTFVQENELELVQRGNVYKFFNGEKTVFADLKEEAAFAHALSLCKEVKNPANDMYSWAKEEVLAAIKDGIVDGFRVLGGFFGSGCSIRAQRFTDRILGEKVRQATLAGFQGE